MSVPFSLLAKALGGATAVVAPITAGVIYREEIKEVLMPSKKNNPDDTAPSVEIKPEDGIWTIEENSEKIKITYPNNKECSINLTGSKVSENKKTVIDKLKEKLISATLTEDNKRYRRGLSKKCSESSTPNELSLEIGENGSFDLSTLFNLSNETLNDFENSKISSGTWTTSAELDNAKTTITITVSNSSEASDPILGTCKIIGTHETGVDKDLTKSKDDINNSIKNKIETDSNKTDNIKKLFTKCKHSFNNEIPLKLQAKTPSGEEEKYEFKNLTDIFPET